MSFSAAQSPAQQSIVLVSETETALEPPADSLPSEFNRIIWCTQIQDQPWWVNQVTTPMRSDAASLPLNLDRLLELTARHSGRVQAIAQVPWVTQAQVTQARGAFDPTFYNDSRFDSTSDPVENSLITGGPPRLEDDIVGIDTGLRGLTEGGMQYNVGQRFGHKNSNSTFFLPNNQGSARLFANITHPLMRNRRINTASSLVLTAQFETMAAQARFGETLQKQLHVVANAYWPLSFQRPSLIQRKRHLERAEAIHALLKQRISHDSNQAQIYRSRAAVAARKSQIAEADTRIRNLESNLRALVNAPELLVDRNAEIIPVQTAEELGLQFDIDAEIALGLANRPELSELVSRLERQRVQLKLAYDQTRPRLDLVAEGYLAGRQGESDLGRAWSNQFTEGRPGYAAGVVFERPIKNRTATGLVRQRRFELRQVEHLLVEAEEKVRDEVGNAVRDVDATLKAIARRKESLQAVTEEVDYLNDRWMSLGNDSRFGQIQLDELLRAQDRLLQEEQALLQARVRYHQALLELQRATGQLVRFAQ